MLTVNKWYPDKHKYQQINIPLSENDNIKLYTKNMDEMMNCINCFKKVKYGEMYTSRIYHNYMGLGYAVCKECHEKECK